MNPSTHPSPEKERCGTRKVIFFREVPHPPTFGSIVPNNTVFFKSFPHLRKRMSELVLLPSFWGCTKPALGLSSQHRLHVASSPGLYYPPLMLHHQRAVIRSVAVEKPEKSTASRPLEKSTARILVHGHVSTLPAQLGLFQTKLKLFF